VWVGSHGPCKPRPAVRAPKKEKNPVFGAILNESDLPMHCIVSIPSDQPLADGARDGRFLPRRCGLQPAPSVLPPRVLFRAARARAPPVLSLGPPPSPSPTARVNRHLTNQWPEPLLLTASPCLPCCICFSPLKRYSLLLPLQPATPIPRPLLDRAIDKTSPGPRYRPG